MVATGRVWSLVFLWMYVTCGTQANVQSKVRCSERWMEVDIVRTSPQARIYLQQLKDYPDEACKPKLSNGIATFQLSLLAEDMSRCGVTRITNKLTGQKVYYHRIIVEEPADSSKHTFTVKCSITEVVVVNPKVSGFMNHTMVRRNVLPDDFEADVNSEFMGEITAKTPVPILKFNVRQGNKIIKDELVVSPGTPLQMEIYVSDDQATAKIYGLLVTYMQVTDTKSQEETIIYNGCSVDPYLFENFNTVDGDFLTAKFRAFKFPESSYVQFRGTVTVCVNKCRGIECSNGQIGYGRRRRSAESSDDEKNEVFQLDMSMFIKVDFTNNGTMDEALSEFIRKGKKRAVDGPVITETVGEQFKYKMTETVVETSSSSKSQIVVGLIIGLLCICRLY